MNSLNSNKISQINAGNTFANRSPLEVLDKLQIFGYELKSFVYEPNAPKNRIWAP